ncbi:MAG: RNA polymerase sigma factor SigL [Pirellulaceae bacterium]|nr:MAG: RNA polymerase sigma factor SigL [Pirellulaceae bacterium]
MADDVPGKLDPERVSGAYEAYAEPLRKFLTGLLRDPTLAQDVLQTTFARLVERGSAVRPEAWRAWLFQVAYREAMVVKRRTKTHQEASRRWVEQRVTGDPTDLLAPLISAETVETIRTAVEKLPEAQQQVLKMRVYEGKTFAEIAAELQVPLGTVLSRMRAAVQKLKTDLEKRGCGQGDIQ